MYRNRNAHRKSHWRSIILIFVVVILLAAGGIVLAARRYYYQNLKPMSKSQAVITVTIPQGATLRQIATTLKQSQLIRDIRVFERYVQAKGVQSQLQAGTYELRPSQSVPDIVDSLIRGYVQTNLFTIVPGQRLDQIKQAMLSGGFDPSAVAVAFDPTQYAGHPALADKPASASLEGYLYPESFQRTATTAPATIIQQSLDQMALRLTPDLKAKFATQKLTTHQAVILASMVEREVPTAADRATVAQVFLKRLRQGIKLESDATASYGAILAGQPPTHNFSSAYNTYQNVGLPPGPISNVSEVSLQAVANPAPTDWTYFVSGDDGKTYFSRTLDEHNTQVSAHCHQKCALH